MSWKDSWMTAAEAHLFECDRCEQPCDSRIVYGSYRVCATCWKTLSG